MKYHYERLSKEIDGQSTQNVLEQLVNDTLERLGEGWRLHSVVPYHDDPLDTRPRAEAAREPRAQQVNDYIVIFEGSGKKSPMELRAS